LLDKSRRVREILDARGLQDTKIVASGDLDEHKIEELVARGAPIDLFGVGTALATSRDVPALGVVYKLVEIERNGRVEYTTKFSDQKVHWPGRKQVYRFSLEGQLVEDVVSRATEVYEDAEPLLNAAMTMGKRARAPRPLEEIRQRTLGNLERLPARYHALRDAPAYPVRKSAALESLLEDVREHYLGAPRATPAE
jgi:nicotinate phosphoribosyltransferase